MRKLLQKFISILRLELEDLQDDVGDLIQLLEKRKDSREITNYVYLGNKGVLMNEIDCIKELLDDIATIDAYKYKSVEAMMEDVETIIDKKIREGAFPEMMHNLVQRKFDKVRKYICESQVEQ
jgi:hypothetical protein